MRAVVAYAANDLRIEARPVVALRRRDISVRITFGGVCGSDLHCLCEEHRQSRNQQDEDREARSIKLRVSKIEGSARS